MNNDTISNNSAQGNNGGTGGSGAYLGGHRGNGGDAKGEALALIAAGPVYRLLGAKDLGISEVPPLDKPIATGSLAFHYHSRGHTAVAADWKAFLEFAERHFKAKGE